jgi:hypothetical protein
MCINTLHKGDDDDDGDDHDVDNNNNNAKGEVTPEIIGPAGTISKSLRQYLRNLPGKHDAIELQNMGTVHILSNVLT